MSRKVFLPVLPRPSGEAERPTIDGMRTRLGGRVGSPIELDDATLASLPLVGETVELTDSRGVSARGIVIRSDPARTDVYLGRGLFRTTATGSLRRAEPLSSEEFLRAARSARAFATLREGEKAWVVRPNETIACTLLEKCRFGAIVSIVDGTILAVSFQRVRRTPSDPGLS